jgi:hypothetical protein
MYSVLYILHIIAWFHFCVDPLSSYFLLSVCSKYVNMNANPSMVLAVQNFMNSGFAFKNILCMFVCNFI